MFREVGVDEAGVDEARVGEAGVDEARVDKAGVDEACVDEACVDEAELAAPTMLTEWVQLAPWRVSASAGGRGGRGWGCCSGNW